MILSIKWPCGSFSMYLQMLVYRDLTSVIIFSLDSSGKKVQVMVWKWNSGILT